MDPYGTDRPHPPQDFAVDLQQHLTALEIERWRAHTAEHTRDRDVLDKAAADVRQALDKAAGEVDRRLVDIREVYQNLLASHLDLHGSDREALRLARDDIERRLEGMNELRAQITGERGLYITRDMLESKLEGLDSKIDGYAATIRVEVRSQGDQIRGEARIAVEKVTSEQAVQNRRLSDLETKAANMDGRFAVLAGVLALAVLVVQFIANQLIGKG